VAIERRMLAATAPSPVVGATSSRCYFKHRPLVQVVPVQQLPGLEEQSSPGEMHVHWLTLLSHPAMLALQSDQTPEHVSLHVPLTHVPLATNSPTLQLVPHVPQLVASVMRSTHVPLQVVVPAPQEHVPLTQVPFAPQPLPQVPQFVASVIKLTQPPLHSVSPGGHCDAHMPAEQTSLA
jgi:hypothetical protein